MEYNTLHRIIIGSGKGKPMDPRSNTDPHNEIAQLRQQLQTLRQSVETMEDILDRYITTRQTQRQSEEQFGLLVSAVRDYAIFMLDAQGHIASWNLGAQLIKGYQADEIIGKHFSVLYPPEDRVAHKPERGLQISAAEGVYKEEGWRVRKDGSYFWASVVITAIYSDTGELVGFGKVTRDLTERKRAEEALRQSEERFRLLVSQVRDYAIFMLDTQGCIVSWNLGAQLIKGYRADEIIGQHFSVFYPSEDRDAHKTERILEIAVEKGVYEEEGWRVRKDGSHFWASVVITALRDDNGVLRGFGKVTRDLTDRKRVEDAQRQLQEQRVQVAREQAARAQAEANVRIRDAFLSATAHELRTPVTSMFGYAELLKRRFDRGDFTTERMQKPVHAIVTQAQRLNRLTTMLLDLTWLEHGNVGLDCQLIDLRLIIERVLQELQVLTDQHTIVLDVPASPLILEADELRLEQVLYNLVQNAIKYSPEGGEITVMAQPEGQQAVITVTDEGVGIPAEDIPQVFERFHRATNISQIHISGLGLGLHLVKEFVTLHGGTVDVQSVVGQGSRFRVILPLAVT
jgi:PAS domain S-box-containing protein